MTNPIAVLFRPGRALLLCLAFVVCSVVVEFVAIDFEPCNRHVSRVELLE